MNITEQKTQFIHTFPGQVHLENKKTPAYLSAGVFLFKKPFYFISLMAFNSCQSLFTFCWISAMISSVK